MNKKLVYSGIGVLVLGGAAWMLLGSGPSDGMKPMAAVKGASAVSAKKGSLQVTITSNGTIKAKNSIQIRPEIESEGKITFLVPEGTPVKAGDVLVELDKTNTQKQVDSLDMNRIQYESELSSAKTEHEIQQGDNQSNIEKAQLKLDFSKLTQEKYEQGEGPQERRKLQLALDQAISEEGRAKDKYEQMPDLLKEGFVTKDQVEEERIKYETRKIEHQSAQLALDLFEKYTFPMTLKQKQTDVGDAQRDYDRAVQKAQSLLQQKSAILSQKERQLKSALDQLERTKKELDHMTIKSPGSGLVVYGDPEQRWWDENRMKVGSNVYGNQVIMTLPDLVETQVLTDVHETDITKVAMNQSVTVTCDTYPGRIFTGKVTKIAALARQDGWRDDAVKKFQVEVSIDGKDHGLKPGVSAKCQILVETLENVLYVPVQAVFVEEGKHNCFAAQNASFSKKQVKLGKSNENFIVIEEGLSEGDEVALFNPEGGEKGGATENKEKKDKEKESNGKSPALPAPRQ